MSNLPPRPARRSAPPASAMTFDEDEYGTTDFLIPETPRVVFGAATITDVAPKNATTPLISSRPITPSFDKPAAKEKTPRPTNIPAASAKPLIPVETVVPKPVIPVFSHAPEPVIPAPVAKSPTTPFPAKPVSELDEKTEIAIKAPNQELHPVAVSIDNALHQAPAMIDSAIQQAPVLIGNIVDHYSEQGKKDRLISNAINGSALVTLVTGVFGPMMLALPLVLAMIGLGWGKKARRNGMSTTLSSFMGWTVIAVSVSGIAIAAAVVGVAAFLMGQ